MKELEERINRMFASVYEAIDRKYLRPLKRDMFKCCHDCLDDKNSHAQVEQCTDDCGRPLKITMSFVTKEVNALQSRLDRCFMDCQDLVRNESDQSKAKRTFEDCAEKCVSKFSNTLPDDIKNICKAMEQLKKN